MNISKKNALNLSLFIIIIYWLYELFVVKQTGKFPDNFSDLAVKIAVNKSIQLAVIILLLRIEGDGWQDIGFTMKNWKKQLLVGILLGLIMFILIDVGLTSILSSIFPAPTDSESIFVYFKDPANLYIWLAIGILGGGLVEEVMRLFILTRFKKKFNNAGLYFALVCSSFIFGMGHLYQGTGAAISTGISGLILGCIYIGGIQQLSSLPFMLLVMPSLFLLHTC